MVGLDISLRLHHMYFRVVQGPCFSTEFWLKYNNSFPLSLRIDGILTITRMTILMKVTKQQNQVLLPLAVSGSSKHTKHPKTENLERKSTFLNRKNHIMVGRGGCNHDICIWHKACKIYYNQQSKIHLPLLIPRDNQPSHRHHLLLFYLYSLSVLELPLISEALFTLLFFCNLHDDQFYADQTFSQRWMKSQNK